MRYRRVVDGDWEEQKIAGDKMMCCDCGLVHFVEYKIVKGHLFARATRDNRATAQARRRG